MLENDLRPGVLVVGVGNSNVDDVAELLVDPDTVVASSDAGAHVQMMCAAGDTTLFLARHVRDRGDLTVEQAVHELTGKHADVFGFHDRGQRSQPGKAADLTVFALDELHWDDDVFVARPARRRAAACADHPAATATRSPTARSPKRTACSPTPGPPACCTPPPADSVQPSSPHEEPRLVPEPKIGERFGVWPQSIGYRLRRAGVKLRTRPGWGSTA